jgi:hypothetical protein
MNKKNVVQTSGAAGAGMQSTVAAAHSGTGRFL